MLRALKVVVVTQDFKQAEKNAVEAQRELRDCRYELAAQVGAWHTPLTPLSAPLLHTNVMFVSSTEAWYSQFSAMDQAVCLCHLCRCSHTHMILYEHCYMRFRKQLHLDDKQPIKRTYPSNFGNVLCLK